MNKFEYKTIMLSRTSGSADATAQLNEQGAEGWELIAVTESTIGYICFLKRIL